MAMARMPPPLPAAASWAPRSHSYLLRVERRAGCARYWWLGEPWAGFYRDWWLGEGEALGWLFS